MGQTLTAAGAILAKKFPSTLLAGESAPAAATSNLPKVYFTRNISGEGLKKLYPLVSSGLGGKIAVKLHTGEPHGPNFIRPQTVRQLVEIIPNYTIVETNTYYDSPRKTTEGHREVLKINGWNFSTVDIMDADGEVNLPVPGGKWFKEMAVGKTMVDYDSMLALTHFKGHSMGGFGGSLKNIAIGCASAGTGKKWIHADGDDALGHVEERLMENMVESAKAITTFFGPKMAFINVMSNMSVDCDCAGTSAAPPTVPDIGVLASTDILAIDQASVDLVYALPGDQNRDLVERIESRKGFRQLSYMDEMGMGSRKYELVSID